MRIGLYKPFLNINALEWARLVLGKGRSEPQRATGVRYLITNAPFIDDGLVYINLLGMLASERSADELVYFKIFQRFYSILPLILPNFRVFGLYLYQSGYM